MPSEVRLRAIRERQGHSRPIRVALSGATRAASRQTPSLAQAGRMLDCPIWRLSGPPAFPNWTTTEGFVLSIVTGTTRHEEARHARRETRRGPTLVQTRRIVTDVPGPKPRELLARQRGAVPAGVGTALPVYVTHAGGGVVVDVDGNSLIDFGSGIAVTSVGNSAERVVARASRQLARFTHACFLVNPYESYIGVCEALNRLTPGDHEKRTLLVNSGAEAVENAVKIARSYTGRPAVVAFDHAFHGRTLLTMTLTSKYAPYKRGFGPFAPEVYRVPTANPYRWPTGAERCAEEAFAQAVYQIERQIGAENVAAVIVEPIQGEGGFGVLAAGFLPRLAAYCQTDRGPCGARAP